jgi:CSLREA domain-containing protein
MDSYNQIINSAAYLKITKAILALGFAALVFLFANGAARAATYTVTSTADTAGAGCAAACTLRQALTASYFDIGGVINFNIPGGGVKTIAPLTPLPNVGHITIDAATQPGYSGTPLIELNGSNVAANPSYGLTISSVTTVRGLIINRFTTAGIYLATVADGLGDPFPVNVTIRGNYIGTNAAGTAALGNGHGIYVKAYLGTVAIGGTGAGERNLISGNNLSGIDIAGCALGSPGIDTAIKGNYIGTDAGGNLALGNVMSGVVDECSNTTLIGGTSVAARNVISANKGVAGVDLQGGTNTVQGNNIGTNAVGTAALGNTNDGIRISSGSPLIGGEAGGAGNLISGNNGNGIKNLAAGFLTEIQGNKIGTNAAGTAAIPNSSNGIYVLNASTEIGGTTGNAGNLISGNGDNGIRIEGSSNISNVIKGNRIGVSNDTLNGVPNTNSGISIAASGTIIGEAGVAAAQNIIAGNFGDGIRLAGTDASGSIIENNLIGTNLSGAVIKNFAVGIEITNGAHDNRIGGSNSTAANTITGSLSDGVQITGSTSVNNAVQNNLIAANGGLGIDLETDGVTANDAGDADPGGNNLQNYPVIQTAFTNRVIGTLNSQPNKTYTIELYRSNACDASGFGEGQFNLGSQTVVTDANGSAAIDAFVSLSAGQIVSATATDASGNTSEFAQCFTATAAPGTLSFSAAAYSAGENAGTATITVTRGFGSTGAISIHYATTSGGTATAGADYTVTSGTLNWASGDTSAKTFTVPVTNDPSDELNETVNLILNNPTGGAGLLTSAAVLTIVDDDNPPQISVNDIAKAEGNQGTTNFVFSLTLSAASGQTVAVDYQTANGTATAGIDYAFNGDTLVFAPGETVKSVAIAVSGDTLPELDETFFVNLQDPQNATLGGAQGTGTIEDDDNPGKLQFGLSGTVTEGAGTATILVSRTSGTAGTVSVDYQTANGTATAGQDYTAASGTLVFLDGQTSATFNVPILQDNLGEASETVFLTLSNPNGGAGLGAPASRTLTILDDDGGLPAKVSISGNVSENNAPLANVLVTLAGSQSKTALTDASGNYQFTNLSAGGNYLVTPVLGGRNFEPFNLSYTNLAASAVNANFTSATGAPARLLRVAGGDTVQGNTVVVPVELVSQGNENSVGFSLNYDANLLSNAQVSLGSDAAAGSLVFNQQTGKLGVIVALPSGQTFAPGTRQVATVTFLTLPTALYSTPVSFGDAPVGRETTDANAGVLPTAYADGAVTFAQGFEADVAPRPTGSGNGSVTVADFTQIGKFVAGTSLMDAAYNEFQRADSAPRGTKGNGFLTVSDYTQAGRYAAGLDAVQTAGGASTANLIGEDYEKSVSLKAENLTAVRNIRVVNAQAAPNSQVLVSVEIDAVGDENAFGFTLGYDAAKLANPLVALGSGTPGTTLIPNTNNAGKIGVVLAFPVNQMIQAGTRQLVTIRFDVAANAPGGQTPLTFSDAPVFREVVNANADPLATVFTDGAVNILSPTAANVTIGGRILDAKGGGLGRVTVSLIDGRGTTRTAVSNTFGNYRFTGVAAGETCVVSVNSKRYEFSPKTQILSVTDNLEDVNFTAGNRF